MRTHLGRAALLALLALVLFLPRLAAAQETDLAKAPRITVAEFKKLRAQGEVVVLDVRDADSFKAGHIPGARSIPLDQLPSHVDELKAANKAVVTYCA